MTTSSIGAQASRLARDHLILSASGTAITIPKLVYGTAWKKERTADLVYLALKSGFRGIDTAAQPKHYNERGVGQGVQRAIKDGIARREDLFIQTKFSPPSSQGPDAPYDLDAPAADKVRQSIESSLRFFAIEGQDAYFDSVIMHSPMRTLDETLIVWEALGAFTPHTIRSLGISNVTLDLLKALYERATLKPSVVQNRFYEDTNFETELRSFCKDKSIVFQAFWTLSANVPLFRSKPVRSVMEKANVTSVAAYFSLVLGLDGITILDGTTKDVHMLEDLEGIEKVGVWAEHDDPGHWASALAEFKVLISKP